MASPAAVPYDTAGAAPSLDAPRMSELLTAAILESALDCIITADHHGRITEFNPAAERTFGYRRQDVVGLPLADVIVPPSLREQHRTGFARYLATGEARVLGRRVEITGMRADGSEFPIELAITPITLTGSLSSRPISATSRSASGRKMSCGAAKLTSPRGSA